MASMTDLNQMLIFATVAKHQSFTQAAQILGMEKSNVSQKISQLEQRLGVRLLNRTTRSVTLTEAGEGYYRYCEHIVEQAEEADQFAENHTTDPQGSLRITAAIDVGEFVMQGVIGPFLEHHPKISIELILTNRHVDLVRDRFDLALRIGDEGLRDSTLIAKKIMTTPIRSYASPTYLKQHGEPTTLAELEQQNVIKLVSENNNSSGNLVRLRHKGKEVSSKLTGRFKVNDMLSCKLAAVLGIGIALLPERLSQEEIKKGLLQPVMQDYSAPDASLFAVYPSRQWMPAKLRVFLDYLERWAREL